MSYPLFDKDEHWHKPEQAFLTDDHRTILRFAVEALMSGKGAVLVTLVEIHGGAARPLGAQMVVREDGRYCGFVSGGCVEAAAAFEALEMMGSGRDREIRYGEGSPWFDIVLPCGGGITLTLHKLRSAQPLLAVLNRLERYHLLDSAEEWGYIRELRNEIAHDYPLMENDVVTILNELASKVPVLLTVYDRLKAVAES